MAAWPQVKAALAAAIPTLPVTGITDVLVFNGPPISGDAPARYVTVGYVDGDNAGTFQTQLEYDGSCRREVGEVRTQIVSQNGETDGSAAEADCFALADALDAWVWANRRLGGVLSPDSQVETTVEVHSISNANGSATALIHMCRYTTTTI